MNTPTNRIGTEWLALTGVGIGLILALIVDQTMLEGVSDRPIIITAIVAVVAMLWIAATRLLFRSMPYSQYGKKN